MTIQINQNILFFTNTLVITDTFLQIEGVKIPWNQVIHFKYDYGPKKIIPQGSLSQLTCFFTPKENRKIYVEHIEVRGHFNGKIYSFFHSSNQAEVSLIDHADHKVIKEKVLAVVEMSDEEAIGFVPSKHDNLIKWGVFFFLGVFNFAGALTFLKFKNHSEIIVDLTLSQSIFCLSFATQIYIFSKSFIDFKKYTGQLKIYTFFLRLGISFVVSLLCYNTTIEMGKAFKYNSALEYKTVDYSIKNFSIDYRKGRKNRTYEVLVLELNSEQLPFFPIYSELDGKCKYKIHYKDVFKIKIYKTLDNQLFYKTVNSHNVKCIVAVN